MEQQHSKSRVGQVITVFATFLVFMGIGVVDPILPEIAAQIGASHWQVEMLFTSYLLMMAIMMIPAGILASRFGDKRLMVTGLIIVTIFAALCGLSNNIPQLSIFRAGWGLGNSFFFATAMTLLIALSGEVKQAVGMYEAAIGLGMAGGPLVGGVLGSSSWRLPFIGTSILIFIAFILVMASGLVSGLNNALFTSYVMEVSPYERGITSGGYNFLRWLGAAFAPLLSGVIGHAIAPQAPFLVAAIIAVVAFVIMKVKVKKFRDSRIKVPRERHVAFLFF
ncbi:MFS transporter [Priestia flexa]|uniref:MFS transporter n=1 Tax=Priestia flexa TaxID=86664 RepID=UPI00288B8994|nr:MFS transporter [Priestia flexa]